VCNPGWLMRRESWKRTRVGYWKWKQEPIGRRGRVSLWCCVNQESGRSRFCAKGAIASREGRGRFHPRDGKHAVGDVVRSAVEKLPDEGGRR
jgi:hypothetical protein